VPWQGYFLDGTTAHTDKKRRFHTETLLQIECFGALLKMPFKA
jgi:hypothetical protein